MKSSSGLNEKQTTQLTSACKSRSLVRCPTRISFSSRLMAHTALNCPSTQPCLCHQACKAPSPQSMQDWTPATFIYSTRALRSTFLNDPVHIGPLQNGANRVPSSLQSLGRLLLVPCSAICPVPLHSAPQLTGVYRHYHLPFHTKKE